MYLQIGEPAPDFTVTASNNPQFHFNSIAGRYVVMCFFGSAAKEPCAKSVHFITKEMRDHFTDDKGKIAFFGVSIDPRDESLPRVTQDLPGIRYFWDFDGKISKLYHALDPDKLLDAKEDDITKVSYYPYTLILDPNLRVIANISMADPDAHNQQVADFITSLPKSIIATQSPQHAPVLLLPRIFEQEFSDRLINLYGKLGGTPSGFMCEEEGMTVCRNDGTFKRRQDYNLEDSEKNKELRVEIRNKIYKRLVPEIYKAFQFKATYIERYLIACYDADTGGFFRAHRDNTTKGTAHRRFAVSINLNAEDYEGGELLFPEFGTQTYKPVTGGAVVFSCSLLHEATAVTKGKRYVFLPFLYDEPAKVIRNANLKFLQED